MEDSEPPVPQSKTRFEEAAPRNLLPHLKPVGLRAKPEPPKARQKKSKIWKPRLYIQ